MNPQAISSIRGFVDSIVAYLPTLLAGLMVLIIGIFVAWLSSRLLVRLLIFMRLDRLLGRLQWAGALRSGDTRHSLYEFIGAIVAVFVFTIFLANALVIWKLTVLSDLLSRFVQFVPQLFAAALTLVIGWALSIAVSRNVQRGLYLEGFSKAALIGRMTRWLLLTLSFAIALIEANVATKLVTGVVLIGLGSVGLAFALAFGMGSRHSVEAMWAGRQQDAAGQPKGAKSGENEADKDDGE
jgi:Mechanosensitive ion channel, conserved TM helix